MIKSTDRYAIRNVLQRHQSILQGFACIQRETQPTTPFGDNVASLSGLHEVAKITSTQEQTKRPMTKEEMLGVQSKSMVSIVRMWEACSEAMDLLLAAKVKISD